MEKELLDYVAERAEVLATNDASTQVTKDAAAAWEAAVAADASDEAVAAATDKLLDVLEGRPTTIDGVIAFAEGPAKQLMGEEVAAAMLAEQLKRKESGANIDNLSPLVHRGKRAACEVRSHRAVAPLRPKAAASKARR